MIIFYCQTWLYSQRSPTDMQLVQIMSPRRNPGFLVELLYNRSIKQKIRLLGEPSCSRRASTYGVSASAAPLTVHESFNGLLTLAEAQAALSHHIGISAARANHYEPAEYEGFCPSKGKAANRAIVLGIDSQAIEKISRIYHFHFSLLWGA